MSPVEGAAMWWIARDPTLMRFEEFRVVYFAAESLCRMFVSALDSWH